MVVIANFYGDQIGLTVKLLFEVVFPVPVFVDLVKNNDWG